MSLSFKPGDYVALTVRRPGSSIYDQIGTYDMTTDDTYFERGINLRHGFLTEYVVDDAGIHHPRAGEHDGRGRADGTNERCPEGNRASLPHPAAATRLEPKRAAVLGASTLGLLATLVLRLRGLEVTAFGNTMPPFLNSTLLEELGARYVSTKEMSLTDASAKFGPFDLIVEGTGFSPLVFEAMNVLARTECSPW